MQVKTAKQNELVRLEQGLESTTAKLRRQKLRFAASQGITRSALLLGGTAMVASAVMIVTRIIGTPMLAVTTVAVTGLLASFVIMGATLLKTWRRIPQLPDVAERLDQAIADHNAIATALDLARSGDRSPIGLLAIETGIEFLRSADKNVQVVAMPNRRHTRSCATLIAGAAVFAISCLVPGRPMLRFPDQVVPRDPQVRNSLSASSLIHTHSSVQKHSSNAVQVAGSPTMSGVPSAPTTPQQTQAGLSLSSESVGSSASATSKVTSAADTIPEQKLPGSDITPVKGDKLFDSAKRPDDGEGQPLKMASSEVAGAAASHGASIGGVPDYGDDPAKSTESRRHNGEGKVSQDTPNDSKKSSHSGDGTIGTDGGDGQINKSGSGGGAKSASTEAPGGNGQSSGQNGVKKSRGVAPLLLGAPQPDLFEGKQLPGSEERTRLQVATRSQPGDPNPASADVSRHADEPMVPTYRVPAEARNLVDEYFERFHIDPAQPVGPIQ